MTYDLETPNDPNQEEPTLPRVFLREQGWRVGYKIGSDKVFCYQMTPGEDHYHRLMDGEIYVFHGEEKLCLPCAERRGLIIFKARPLRDKMAGMDVSPPTGSSEYDLS